MAACPPSFELGPPATLATSCDFLSANVSGCGGWDGALLGSSSKDCHVDRFSQELDRLHVTSEGCSLTSSGSVDAPFVYQRVDTAELVVTVEVNVASTVQWDEGGLLVMAEGDASEWLALRSMQGQRLALVQSTREGTFTWDEAVEGHPWVRLERRAEYWRAWWRRSTDEP